VGVSFKDLVVWQRAVELSKEIYRLTTSFPTSEQFGLSNQMRRASVFIASNIAEGYGRSTRGEYLQFLGHARGSNCELQTQLVIAKAIGFGATMAYDAPEKLSADVSRMLIALMSKLAPEPPRSLVPLVPRSLSLFRPKLPQDGYGA
jgi:four helix bundle protein